MAFVTHINPGYQSSMAPLAVCAPGMQLEVDGQPVDPAAFPCLVFATAEGARYVFPTPDAERANLVKMLLAAGPLPPAAVEAVRASLHSGIVVASSLPPGTLGGRNGHGDGSTAPFRL